MTPDEPRVKLSSSERIFLGLFVLANLLIPALLIECYPFSMVPMYSSRLAEFSQYHIFAPDGTELRTDQFSLDPSYLSASGKATSPLHRHRARIPRYSENVLGQPALTAEELSRAVGEGAARLGLPYVTVKQVVYGAVDSQRAGPIRTVTYMVRRQP